MFEHKYKSIPKLRLLRLLFSYGKVLGAAKRQQQDCILYSPGGIKIMVKVVSGNGFYLGNFRNKIVAAIAQVLAKCPGPFFAYFNKGTVFKNKFGSGFEL